MNGVVVSHKSIYEFNFPSLGKIIIGLQALADR